MPWRRRWHSHECSWERIPWTEEPSGLQSMGSQRAGHNLSERAHTCVSHEDFHAVEPADALVDMTQCHEREGGAVRGSEMENYALKGETWDRNVGAWRTIKTT